MQDTAERRYPKMLPPRDQTEKFLELALEFERAEIAFLQRLCEQSFGRDDVSFALLSHLLEDEVEDEEKWQKLRLGGIDYG